MINEIKYIYCDRCGEFANINDFVLTASPSKGVFEISDAGKLILKGYEDMYISSIRHKKCGKDIYSDIDNFGIHIKHDGSLIVYDYSEICMLWNLTRWEEITEIDPLKLNKFFRVVIEECDTYKCNNIDCYFADKVIIGVSGDQVSIDLQKFQIVLFSDTPRFIEFDRRSALNQTNRFYIPIFKNMAIFHKSTGEILYRSDEVIKE